MITESMESSIAFTSDGEISSPRLRSLSMKVRMFFPFLTFDHKKKKRMFFPFQSCMKVAGKTNTGAFPSEEEEEAMRSKNCTRL
jgi:hypothetical protein